MIEGLEKARRSCGGLGYSSWSGFTNMFQNFNPIPTYEGDNTVMLGQACRYLIKLVKKAQKSQTLSFPYTYINRIEQNLSMKNKMLTVEDYLNIDLLDLAL